MRPSWRWLVGATLLAAALGAHVVYWYFPRERLGSPDPEAPSGRLYLSGDQEVRLWMPYPHQNVALARRHLRDPQVLLGALGRLAGIGEHELPAFGPFSMPPSRALAVAVGRRGSGDVAVAVEVYPVLGWIARLAGTLAGNPLLAGGPVVLSGRRWEVGWDQGAWTLVSETRPGPRSHLEPPEELGLAWLTLERARHPLPAGAYRLWREGREVVLSTESSALGASSGLEESARRLDLAYLEARFRSPERASVLVLPSHEMLGLELPDAAVVWTVGAERSKLPAEAVLRVLGVDLLQEQMGRWRAIAVGPGSLEAVRRLAPELGPYLDDGDLASLLWLRPAAYRPLTRAVADVLDSLPVAARGEVSFWRDVHAVLGVLEGAESLAVRVGANGAVEARLRWVR